MVYVRSAKGCYHIIQGRRARFRRHLWIFTPKAVTIRYYSRFICDTPPPVSLAAGKTSSLTIIQRSQYQRESSCAAFLQQSALPSNLMRHGAPSRILRSQTVPTSRGISTPFLIRMMPLLINSVTLPPRPLHARANERRLLWRDTGVWYNHKETCRSTRASRVLAAATSRSV